MGGLCAKRLGTRQVARVSRKEDGNSRQRDRLDELEPKVAALANGGEAALFLSADPILFSWRAEIMLMAMRYRLPTACAGGLVLGIKAE